MHSYVKRKYAYMGSGRPRPCSPRVEPVQKLHHLAQLVHPHAADSDVLGTTAINHRHQPPPSSKLSSADTNSRVGVTAHAVALNAGPPARTRQHQDELFDVQDGTFEFVLGDPAVWHAAVRHLGAHPRGDQPHKPKRTPGTLALLYLPAGGQQFFRDLDTIDQTDTAALQALAARYDMTFPAPALAWHPAHAAALQHSAAASRQTRKPMVLGSC